MRAGWSEDAEQTSRAWRDGALAGSGRAGASQVLVPAAHASILSGVRGGWVGADLALLSCLPWRGSRAPEVFVSKGFAGLAERFRQNTTSLEVTAAPPSFFFRRGDAGGECKL